MGNGEGRLPISRSVCGRRQAQSTLKAGQTVLEQFHDCIFEQDYAGIIQKISFGDLAEVYAHKYLDEMRRAYEKLAAMIETIVNPPTDNVVAFAKV